MISQVTGHLCHLCPTALPSGTHPGGEGVGQPTGGGETGLRGRVHHVPWTQPGEVSGEVSGGWDV